MPKCVITYLVQQVSAATPVSREMLCHDHCGANAWKKGWPAADHNADLALPVTVIVMKTYSA